VRPLPILCYHKVGPESEEGRWLNVEPARLESHVRFFARRGRRFVLPRELAAWPTEPAVCFTFDDAYVSAVSLAPPIFLRHRATAAFYAVPRHVGGASDWDGEKARALADWGELSALAAQGFEVGNHSMTHPRMAEIDADACLREAQEARAALEEHNLAPASFCYPYGSLNPAAMVAVQASGHMVGLALGKRMAEESDDRLALPRIVVAFSDALPKLLYKMYLRPLLP